MTTTTVPAASTAPPVPKGGAYAARDLLAMLPGVAPTGVAVGVAAGALHAGAVPTVLGAGLVYAGSAQLTVTTLAAAGGGLLPVVAAGLLVNSRLALYGAGLEARFRGQSLAFRLFAAHFVIDPTYAAATARRDLDDAGFRRYWLRLGWGLMALWTAAVAVGVLLAPHLPRLPHLGLVAAAMFAAMVLPRLHQRPAVAAAVTSAAVALAALAVLPALAVPLGALAGAAAATVLDRRSA